DGRMLRAIGMSRFILHKHYNWTHYVPVYATALLLDPSRRAAYVRKDVGEACY
ncbi:hypothetical protein BDV95DRAFT_487482, partial [Massariosphaeria phaeospora]